jgi:hypothetical protein
MPTPEAAVGEAAQRLAALLESAPKPLSFSQLKTRSHLSDAEMKSALEAAVNEKAVFRWPDYGGSQYFWRQAAGDAARQAVFAVASEEALSQSQLVEKARKRVGRFSEEAMKPIVADLVRSEQLQKVPAFTSASGKLLIRPRDAAAYTSAARKFMANKFRSAGFDADPFDSPSPSQPTTSPAATEALANPGEQLLKAIRDLEPVDGNQVSAERLRHHLPALSKRELDSAAIHLRNAEKVFLHLHHDPHNLPQDQRDLLIDGGDGAYYVGIAIRN